MVKNAEGVLLKKSRLTTNGKPNLPSADKLVEGELAINYAYGVETISTKNENGRVVTFSSDDYYTEQKLGSGFTNENSAKTVTEAIESIEGEINDLDNKKLDVSAYTPIDLSNYYTKDETSGKTEISNALSNKVNTGTFVSHTANTNIHLSELEKTNIDSLADNIATISGITSSDVTKWGDASADSHVHPNKETLDEIAATSTAINSLTGAVGTMAFESTTSYSSATDVNDALGNKLNVSDFNTYSGTVESAISTKASQSDLATLSGTVTAHTASTDIHMNATEKENVDSLADNIAAISGITSTKVGNWDTAVSNSHTHSNKTSLDEITDLKIGNWDTAYSNSHTHNNKIALDSLTGTVGTMAYEDVTSYSSATDVNDALGNKLNVSDFNTYSGTVETEIDSKAANSDLTTLSGTVTAHTATTDIHMNATEKENVDSLTDNIAAISGITSTKVGNWDTAVSNSHTHSNKIALDSLVGAVGTMAYENATSYSSATQVNNALNDKSDVGHTHEISGVTNLQNALNGKSDTNHKHDDRYYTETEVNDMFKALSGSSTGSASKTLTSITESSGVVTANYASISITKSQVSDFPSSMTPTAHNQASNTISAMTSYSIASASGAVSTNDTLNQAIGKLEKRIAILEAALGGMTLVKLTSAQYEALTVKDPNTMYVIND